MSGLHIFYAAFTAVYYIFGMPRIAEILSVERGGFYIGGEILVPFVLVFGIELVRNAYELFFDI